MRKNTLCSAITLAIAIGDYDKFLAAKCTQHTSSHIVSDQARNLPAHPMTCMAETSDEEPTQA